MKLLKAIFFIFVFLISGHAALAQEKQLNIKGLYIGMPVAEAHAVINQILPREKWKTSEVGKAAAVLAYYRVGESRIFGEINRNSVREGGIVGDYGFAITNNYDYYEGFVSSDQNNNVTRISLDGQIVDFLFGAAMMNANSFAPTFWQAYNMPAFNWIPLGWVYTSPLGYKITIMNDKFIDVKKE